MRGIKVILFLIVITLLFSQNIFSLITSRIEGVVMDEVTGNPIVGAKVVLYECNQAVKNYCNKKWSVITGTDGLFKFNIMMSGEYFLCIYKDGYARFGPVFDIEPKFPSMGIGSIPAHKVERFSIKQGEIKHFKIRLEKEAILEVKINRKTPQGTEPVSESHKLSIIVYLPDNSFYDTLPAPSYDENTKSYRYYGMSGGQTVRVQVSSRGYPKGRYEVNLEKGKTTTIDYLMDFTTGQVVHGFVRDKTTGKPLSSVYLALHKKNPFKAGPYTYTDKNGEYWFGGIEPGNYQLYIRGPRGIKTGRFFEIKDNEKIELNIEL